jgi:hypothetical protein
LTRARRPFAAIVKRTNGSFAREVAERIAVVYASEKKIRSLQPHSADPTASR